jgi:hypothetical protein
MIKNKIIFISGTPQSKVSLDKLDINWFISNNVHVEYWNLTNIYYSQKSLDLYFGGHPEYRNNDFPIEREFNSIKNVKESLREVNKGVLFCSLDGFMQSYFWLLRSFKKHNLHYYIGPWRTNHEYEFNQVSISKKIINSLFDGTLFNKLRKSNKTNIDNPLTYNLKLIIYKKTSFYQKPDFIIGTGSFGRKECFHIFGVKNFISIKSIDLLWEKLPSLLNYRYCVYVDESIIYSPNTGLNEGTNNNSTTNDIEQFQSNICSVFDLVEKTLGVKVIIACSGKYKYEDESIYGMREMIYGKTNHLIQHSELALGHASSGLYQAIIDRKPVILLNDPSFIEDKKSQIPPFAKMLNVKSILTTSFSSEDLENLDNNLINFQKLEEQYLSEKNSVENYKKIILNKLETLNSYEV